MKNICRAMSCTSFSCCRTMSSYNSYVGLCPHLGFGPCRFGPCPTSKIFIALTKIPYFLQRTGKLFIFEHLNVELSSGGWNVLWHDFLYNANFRMIKCRHLCHICCQISKVGNELCLVHIFSGRSFYSSVIQQYVKNHLSSPPSLVSEL